MSVEALERHAERGTARGPATVWTEAVGGPVPERPPRAGRQRVLVWAGVATLALAGSVVLRDAATREGSGDASPPSSVEVAVADGAGDGEGSAEGVEPTGRDLPTPLLIDGMELAVAQVPFDPEACCADDVLDELMDSVVGPSGSPELSPDGDPSPVRTQVFARGGDLTAGPVLGIEHLPGGGFRPWGANLTGTTLEALTAGMERVGDDWRPDPSTGLTEVADVTEADRFARLRFAWQFDFRAGDRRATIQSESADRSSVALWLVRLLAGTDGAQPSVNLQPVVVGPGLEGLAIVDPRPDDDTLPTTAEVIWETDGWVHRLTLGRLDGDTMRSGDAREVAVDVRLADRDRWRDAVVRSPGRPGGTGLAGQALAFAVGALVVVAVTALVGRRWVVAPAVLLGLGLGALLADSGTGPAALLGLVAGAVVAVAVPPTRWRAGLGPGRGRSVDCRDEGNPR